MPTPPSTGTKPRVIKGLGWKRDLPDRRDHYFNVSAPGSVTLPPSVDLRPGCPPVYDQGQLGSCTANALAAAFQFDEIAQGKASGFTPSRLFIYYNERYIEGNVDSDAGASLRDGIRVIAAWGVVDEKLWPYDVDRFADFPGDDLYQVARTERIANYSRLVQKLDDLRTCLAGGRPFVMGFTVYESFQSQEVKDTGDAPMPGRQEQALGGHAVLVVGYDDAAHRFLVRNSWGDQWGMEGYFTLPYEYVLNADLCGDLWTIKTVP
jgi:C1A family cysteine protease